jgi:Na+/melibiose symporter-like transporter
MDDLRVPIGSFFVILGVMLLIAYFFVTASAPLASPRVNLWCGLAMLVFGAVMLWLARRSKG